MGDNVGALVIQRAQEQKKKESDLYGQVLWGANNIFLVVCEDERERSCRLRGKTLQQELQEHSPLVCGDFVLLQPLAENTGQIYERIARHNILRRRNLKRGEPQAFAANVDAVILMVAWKHPPLRMAFLDRLLIAAEQTQVPIQVLVNKLDSITSLKELWQLRCFLQQYRRLGISIAGISLLVEPKNIAVREASFIKKQGLENSIKKFIKQFLGFPLEKFLISFLLYSFYIWPTKFKLQKLYSRMNEKLCVILGASGVGKSTLCNYFFPEQPQETRAISEKWQRGVHTTSLARILRSAEGYRLIDTPGMRNFLPELGKEELQDLQNYYPEFRSLRRYCAYSGCQHRDEPDCRVREAAEYGLMPRYQSYLNLYGDLEESLVAKPIYQTQKEGNKKQRGQKAGRKKLQLQTDKEGYFSEL